MDGSLGESPKILDSPPARHHPAIFFFKLARTRRLGIGWIPYNRATRVTWRSLLKRGVIRAAAYPESGGSGSFLYMFRSSYQSAGLVVGLEQTSTGSCIIQKNAYNSSLWKYRRIFFITFYLSTITIV